MSLLILTLFLTSCSEESLNPLASPKEGWVDRRLIGSWQRDDSHFTIAVASPHSMTMSFPDSDTKNKQHSTICFSTIIGKETFLNYLDITTDKHGKPVKRWEIFRYSISNGRTLTLWDIDLPKSAVENGQIKTEKDPIDPSRVILSDTTPNLVRFIRNSDIEKLFPGEGGTYSRVERYVR